MSHAPELLTVKEAAAKLKSKPATIRSWLKKGILQGRKIGKRRWLIPSWVIEQFTVQRIREDDRRDDAVSEETPL